jgi:hypothetical protein
MAAVHGLRLQRNDEYTTTRKIWDDLVPLLQPHKDKTIWMPFYREGHAGNVLREHGFEVYDKEGEDFFAEDAGPPILKNTIVVDNIPFSKKEHIFKKLRSLNVPFCVIVPVTTITYAYTLRHLDHGFQIVIPKTRMKFLGQKRPPFACIWLAYNMKFENDITRLA